MKVPLFMRSITSQEPPSKSAASDSFRSQTVNKTPYPSNQGERSYATVEDVELSSELLDLTTKASTKPLTKAKWKELSANSPTGMREPTMEAGMKEEIRKSNAVRKTEDVFVFDDGLAEQQGPIITVAGPILSALMHLDSPPDEEGENGIILMSCGKC